MLNKNEKKLKIYQNPKIVVIFCCPFAFHSKLSFVHTMQLLFWISNRNNRDEFTLNAALILNKRPELGIIYAPAKKRLFYSYAPGHCYEYSNKKEIKLNSEKKTKAGEIIAESNSDNLKPQISEIHKEIGVTSHKKMKSSFKFCVIATGEYDLYVAEPRASEWDIAAAHAVLNSHGGSVINIKNEMELEYAKESSILNPYFIAFKNNTACGRKYFIC